MKSKSALIMAGLAIAGVCQADLSAVPAGQYALDKTHGYVTFSYSHLGFSKPSVRFDEVDVTLELDNEDPENSTLSVVIDPASVDSDVDVFDEHLVGEKYFDVANHPSMTFESTSITRTGDDTFDVTGSLSIKGETHPVTLSTTINKAAMHPFSKAPTIGISASATVMRSDFGMASAVPMVSDAVDIQIEVELPKVKANTQ